MNENLKTRLKRLGEDTIYTAKGHFKAHDIRKYWSKTLFIACIIFDIFGLAVEKFHYISYFDNLSYLLNLLGIIFTMILLFWERECSNEYYSEHLKIGEAYLAIHKQAEILFNTDSVTEAQINALEEECKILTENLKESIIKFPIEKCARAKAKKAIEKRDPETVNWWK